LAQNYLYFDPRQLKSGPAAVPKRRAPFEEAVVFMVCVYWALSVSECVPTCNILAQVGGGNYLEYQNLQDWSKRGETKRSISYGVRALMAPVEFLDYLARLAGSGPGASGTAAAASGAGARSP
jgi:hypothetical protein